MIVYFDASAFVKLLVDEDGSATATQLWNDCDSPVSSRLAYPEVRAAIAAAERGNRLTVPASTEAVRVWELIWLPVRVIELSMDLARRAGELARVHSLSGADAVHLASALNVGPIGLTFASWDRRLRDGAATSGLPVAPSR